MTMERKKLYILVGSVLAGLLFLTGLFFMVRGCGRGETPSSSRENQEAGYKTFLNTGFESLEEASKATAAWMGRFIATGDDARVGETQAILDCFLQMEDFFAREFPSDRSFQSQMKYMGTRFMDSPYPVVRKTWLRISSQY